MPVKTKRIVEPLDPSDGQRVLITRYRPRGVRKGAETWDVWDKRVAPSVELLDAFFGKRRDGRKVVAGAEPIAFDELARRYAEEMRAAEGAAAIGEYAARIAAGETITFLCYCAEPARCHRTLLEKLVQQRAKQLSRRKTKG